MAFTVSMPIIIYPYATSSMLFLARVLLLLVCLALYSIML